MTKLQVQTGFGRTGTDFWGFQGHGVIPDIGNTSVPLFPSLFSVKGINIKLNDFLIIIKDARSVSLYP